MAGLLAILGSSTNVTNVELAKAWSLRGLRVELVAPSEARRRLRAGDIACARLDVRPELDGVEPGLVELFALERRGAVRVLNRAAALLGSHDKLLTARLLRRARLPHPATFHLRRGRETPSVEPPVVVKPRFGSWGRDVFLYQTRAELELALPKLWERRWFRQHGAIVQELVPPQGHDLRVIVAGGRVVGAAQRIAAPREWRTNISLGGALRRAVPPPAASELAIAAAGALGADLIGIDLLPLPEGGHTVLELNGAVDFDDRYSLPASDVYAEIIEALGLEAARIEVLPLPA